MLRSFIFAAWCQSQSAVQWLQVHGTPEVQRKPVRCGGDAAGEKSCQVLTSSGTQSILDLLTNIKRRYFEIQKSFPLNINFTFKKIIVEDVF